MAAGDAFGAVGIATIMKLSRVLMLVFAAIIIAIWWDRNHSEMPADGKRKVSFPWFMLGFIGASIIGTFVPFIDASHRIWWTSPTSCSAWPWRRSASM